MKYRSLVAAYGLSGAVSLALQVLWFRSLELSIGSSSPAVTALLAGYMLGLSAGSLAGSVLVRRKHGDGTRLLAALHLLFLLSGAFLTAGRGHVVFPAGTPPLLQWAAGIALIFPTGAVAGASFPAAASVLKEREGRQREVMGLYGMNIIGGLAGMSLVAFAGLELAGRRGCTVITVVVSALLALWFYGSGRTSGSIAEVTAPASGPAGEVGPAGDNRLWVAAAVALGFIGLGLETIVVRLLTPIMGLSVYALAATVVPYLAGLGLGALLARKLVRGAALRTFVSCAVAASLLWGLTALLLPLLPSFIVWSAMALSGAEVAWGGLMASQVAAAMAIIVPATVAAGTLFPLALYLGRTGTESAAGAAGRLNAANALGAAIGPIAAGLALVPLAGVQGSFRLLAGGYLLLGLTLAGRNGLRPGIAGSAAALSALLLLALAPKPDPLDHHAGVYWAARRYAPLVAGPVSSLNRASGTRREVLEVIEGPTASVLVVRTGRQLYLTVDGKPASNTLLDSPTQLALGRIPLSLKPDAKKVLVIGWGSGQTAAEVLRYPVEKVTSVEISPEVVDAAPWFASVNGRALSDPRFSLVVDDGRHYLATTGEHFDVIISQPSNPWVGASSALFTREFFELCRDRLTKGGILVQWFQTYGAGEEEMAIFDATFSSVFPRRALWRPQPGDLVIAAPVEPEVAGTPAGAAFRTSPPDQTGTGATVPLNTDDRPLLAFRLARRLLDHDSTTIFPGERRGRREERSPAGK